MPEDQPLTGEHPSSGEPVRRPAQDVYLSTRSTHMVLGPCVSSLLAEY